MPPQKLLSLYFAPLANYAELSQNLSTQPLWLYRQQALAQRGFESQLENVDLTGVEPEVVCIIQCLRLSLDKQNALSNIDGILSKALISLHEHSEHALSSDATSLWLTLSFRDTNKSIRKAALEYLDTQFDELNTKVFINFSYANFSELESKLDFSGQYLLGVDFSENIYLKGFKFKYACLSQANFLRSVLKYAFFEGAWLDDVKFDGATLNDANFNYVVGLEVNILPNTIKQDDVKPQAQGGLFNILEDMKAVAARYCEQEAQTNNFNEQLPSPAWPVEGIRWRQDDAWGGDNKEIKLCCLTPDEDLFKLISHGMYVTSDYHTISDAWLFNNQLQAALFDKKDLAEIVYAINNTPTHEAFVGSITVQSIEIIFQPTLWQKYHTQKVQIAHELTNPSPLSDEHFPLLKHDLNPYPVVDMRIGECFLYHGVKNTAVMPLIIQNGFTKKFMKESKRGWGELGKGLYLAEDFAKSATYVRCPKCEVSPCRCGYPKPERQIFLTRTTLGNMREDRFREHRFEAKLPEPYHSNWGPIGDKVKDSQFKHNEFAIPKGKQIYPEFMITYVENPKEFEPKPESVLLIPKAWAAALKRVKIENDHPLSTISQLLTDYHRLLCYRAADSWSLQRQLMLMEKILSSVKTQTTQSFDEKTLSDILYQSLIAEGRRLGVIEGNATRIHTPNELLHHLQSGCYAFQTLNYAKAHSHLQQWLAYYPEDVAVLSTLIHIYFKLTAGALNVFSQHDFIKSVQTLEYADALALETLFELHPEIKIAYYTGCMNGIIKGNIFYKTELEQRKWVKQVLIWHANTNSITLEEKKELHDKLPREYQNKFAKKIAIKHQEAFMWPDTAGVRLNTSKTQEAWDETITKKLTQKEGTGVKLQWMALNKTGLGSHQAYLSKETIQQLFTEKGELFLEKGSSLEGRCLVKALCGDDGEPLAFIKFYPKYPLLQMFSGQIMSRLSGYAPTTTIAFITHEKTKQCYPVLISKPLGMSPSKKISTQRHLLAWEMHGKDVDIENNLDDELFAWKLMESYLLQDKDAKNDNLFPFINPKTNQYGLIVGDADRILCQHPLEKEVVKFNSNLFLMEQMTQSINPKASKAFQKLDTHVLLEEVLNQLLDFTQGFKPWTENILTQYNTSFEKLSTGKPLNLSGKKIDTDCYLNHLFRDQDLPLLHQRIRLLNSHISTSNQTYDALFTHLIPHAALAYHKAIEAAAPTLTSSARFLKLNNKNKQLKKEVEIEEEGTENNVTIKRTITYSETVREDAQSWMSNLRQAHKRTEAQSEQLSNQLDCLENLYDLPQQCQTIFDALHKQDDIKPFVDAPSDHIRELVFNRIKWTEISLGIAQKLFELLPQYSFRRLKLKSADITDDQLRAHLKKNPYLSELYLSECNNINGSVFDVYENQQSNLKTLRLIELDNFKHLGHLQENVFNPEKRLFFQNLKKLIFKDCDNTLSLNIEAPFLEIISIHNLPKLFVCRTKSKALSDVNIKNCEFLSSSELVYLNLGNTTNTVVHFKGEGFKDDRQCWLNLLNIQPFFLKLPLEEYQNLFSPYIKFLSAFLVKQGSMFNQAKTLNAYQVQKFCLELLDSMSELAILVDKQLLSDLLKEIKADKDSNAQRGMYVRTNNKEHMRRVACQTLGVLGLGGHAIIPLLKTMNSKYLSVRRATCLDLKVLGSDDFRVIDALLVALKDENEYVGAAACQALGALGSNNSDVIDALLEVTKHKSQCVRKTACFTLGKSGSDEPRVIEALLALMKDKNEDNGVRIAACHALSKLGSNRKKMLDAFLNLMKDKGFFVETLASKVLGKLSADYPRVMDALLEVAKDENWDVRKAACFTLGESGSDEPRVIEALLALMKDKDLDVRAAACRALGQLGANESRIIKALLDLMKDTEAFLKKVACRALAKLGAGDSRVKGALFHLIEEVDKDLSNHAIESADWVRSTVAGVFGALGLVDSCIIDLLLDWMKNQCGNEQVGACKALGVLGSNDSRVIDAFRMAIKDENKWVRRAACEALGALGSDEPRVIEALLGAIKDESEGVRISACQALGRLESNKSEVIDALLLAIKDEEPRVRKAAFQALGRLESDKFDVIDGWLVAIKDKNIDVRMAACEALGVLGSNDSRVIDVLFDLMRNDKNTFVRGVACETLREILQNELGKVLETFKVQLEKIIKKAKSSRSNLVENKVSRLSLFSPVVQKRQAVISGWEIKNVPGDGNCFYHVLAEKLKLIKHERLNEIPVGTELHDVLRLDIQQNNFSDAEWTGDENFEAVVRRYNVILAIVDTRNPEAGFTCYFVDEKENYGIDTDGEFELPDRPVIKMAYTGNHYTSVVSHPALNAGAYRQASEVIEGNNNNNNNNIISKIN